MRERPTIREQGESCSQYEQAEMAAEPSEGKGESKWYGKKDPRLHYLSQTG